jgi:hypothetical protein
MQAELAWFERSPIEWVNVELCGQEPRSEARPPERCRVKRFALSV